MSGYERAGRLDDGSQLRPLPDGAFGIQLGGHVGTADDVHRLASGLQTGLQLLEGLLSAQMIT